MKILISGASGFIGTHLISALRKQHQLKVCVRNPDKLQRLCFAVETVKIDFRNLNEPADWMPMLEGIEVVINCVGIIAENAKQKFRELHTTAPQALFEAAQLCGVSKVIQISALGADENARSHYHLSKKAADDMLSNLDLDWFILRPSIVYGPGAQSMALFHALAALPVQAVLDHGLQKIQPVHIDDLVATVEACLDKHAKTRRTVDVVGPDAIGFSDLLGRLRKRLGKQAAPIFSVDSRLAIKFGFAGKLFGIPALSAGGIQMLARGNCADPAPLAELLGHRPASLKEKLTDYPATQAERWHAGLFFLKPLLRFTLAIVWIISGVVSSLFFPPARSYEWLAVLGFTGALAPLTLYGLAAMDVALGVALLIGYRVNRIIALQIFAMLFYMGVIGVGLPEFWLHPFGPLVKNLPLLVASLVLMVLEGEKP